MLVHLIGLLEKGGPLASKDIIIDFSSFGFVFLLSRMCTITTP